MKKLPKYIHKQINEAIKQVQKPHDYFNDWEIFVQHWGDPKESVSYYGQSLENALAVIKQSYSHTKKNGCNLILLSVRALRIEENEGIVDCDHIYELELTKD
jgi:hypothetical protein